MGNEEDDTVLIAAPRSPAPQTRSRRPGWRLIVCLVILLCGAAAVPLLFRLTHSRDQAIPVSAQLADEDVIAAHIADRITVFRFAPDTRTLVLDFPTLAQQGKMLNRLAAFVERRGAPHDRVLDDGTLDQLIRQSGLTPETFYYGHDYRAADIARFFMAADRQGLQLNVEEEQLRILVRAERWLSATVNGALISIPRAGVDAFLDSRARRVMLHHELSHAEYFNNSLYAKHAAEFWRDSLSAVERSRFRAHLAQQDYDPSIEDVMINEMQAYLIHTSDLRFFNPRDVGVSEDRRAALRATFLIGMPGGWLGGRSPP